MSGVWIVRCVALDAGAGGEVRHVLVGGDVLGAAVGVAGVVERVDADEDVGGTDISAYAKANERKTVLRAGT